MKHKIVHMNLGSFGLACNQNLGGASGLEYTYDVSNVTCKNCLKSIKASKETNENQDHPKKTSGKRPM